MKTSLLGAKASEVSHPLPFLWLTLCTLSGCGSLKLLMISEQGTDLSTAEYCQESFYPYVPLAEKKYLAFV